MFNYWVVNASPLILLTHVKQTHLLTQLAERVIIPQAVAVEIAQGPDNDPAKQLLAAKKFTVMMTPAPPPELLAWDLGAGETAVLAYAQANPTWTAILDDGAARKCARALGISVKGTLAVIILAKQHGLIPSATQLLQDLRAHGFRINENLLRQLLPQTVGEDWL